MSVDDKEIDDILAEDYGDTEFESETLKESIEEALITTPPSIYISLEHPYYVAGDRLQGEVLLEIPKSLGNASLNLISQGTEEIHIFQQSKLLSQQASKVFALNTTLKTWENLTKGHYSFPFTFKIPHHVPPTFYYSGEDSSKNFLKAQVSYLLSSKLLYGDEECTFSCNLNIRSKDYHKNPKVEIEATENVEGICCMNKGFTTFKLGVTSENHPLVNSGVSFKLTPDNGNCAAPINQVVADIVYYLEIVDKEKTYNVRHVVSSIPRITWIAAYTSLVFEKDFEFNGELKIGGDELNLCSIDTNMIRCKYAIEVSVNYDLKFKRDPAFVCVNFVVLPNLIKNTLRGSVSAWNPVVEEMAKLVLEEN